VGGFGLHELFTGLGDRLVGILNGIDGVLWDPSTDPQITARYTAADLSGKQKCKTAAQRGFGLSQRAHTPLFAISARLVAQKGLDLLINGTTLFNHDAQYVVLGDGEERFRVAFAQLAQQMPGRFAVEFGFKDRLEHRLLAGADLLLMPSLYEPCGLTQMRAMRYGTIPVARAVGGLADTIADGVNGFLFTENTPEALDLTLERAITDYSDSARWRAYIRAAMGKDFGWERSAGEYLASYRRAMAAHAGAR
jgi:starch synthase